MPCHLKYIYRYISNNKKIKIKSIDQEVILVILRTYMTQKSRRATEQRQISFQFKASRSCK